MPTHGSTTQKDEDKNPFLLVKVTRWYRTKRLMRLRSFSDLLFSLSELKSFPIYPPEFFALVAAEAPTSETGRNGEKWPLNFAYSISIIIRVIFNIP
jgi:hypothetical protein